MISRIRKLKQKVDNYKCFSCDYYTYSDVRDVSFCRLTKIDIVTSEYKVKNRPIWCPLFWCPKYENKEENEKQPSIEVMAEEIEKAAFEEAKKPSMNFARKDDQDKLRYELIPCYPLEELAKVYTIGAKKYGDDNWRKGMSWKRIFGALLRHAWAYWRGEKIDPKDGQHHLASVAWNAFTLMEYEQTHTELDDRIKQQ